MSRIKKTSQGYEVYGTINQLLGTFQTFNEASMYSYGKDEVQQFVMQQGRKRWVVIDKRDREPADWKVKGTYKTKEEAQKALKVMQTAAQSKAKKTTNAK